MSFFTASQYQRNSQSFSLPRWLSLRGIRRVEDRAANLGNEGESPFSSMLELWGRLLDPGTFGSPLISLLLLENFFG
jgi:hypothetical protein